MDLVRETTKSGLTLLYDVPVTINVTQKLVWKENTLTDRAAEYGITKAASYATISGIDKLGDLGYYQISLNTFKKCQDKAELEGSDLCKMVLAWEERDGRTYSQLVLPTNQGSDLVMAALTASIEASKRVATQNVVPQGDNSVPF